VLAGADGCGNVGSWIDWAKSLLEGEHFLNVLSLNFTLWLINLYILSVHVWSWKRERNDWLVVDWLAQPMLFTKLAYLKKKRVRFDNFLNYYTILKISWWVCKTKLLIPMCSSYVPLSANILWPALYAHYFSLFFVSPGLVPWLLIQGWVMVRPEIKLLAVNGPLFVVLQHKVLVVLSESWLLFFCNVIWSIYILIATYC
jgi:hypothetical protein